MSYCVVTLNKYPEVLAGFVQSIADHENAKTWHINVPTLENEPFIYARNANRGIVLSAPDDLILCNDDVRLIQPDTFGRMSDAALASPNIGILGTLVRGGIGNPFQDERHVERLWLPEWKTLEMLGKGADVAPVCFVCVYLKRRMIEEIGPMDESFVGYGWDDNDYCVRARRAGWKTVIARDIVVQHGDGSPTQDGRGKSWSTSFARADYPDNTALYMAKYGLQAKSA